MEVGPLLTSAHTQVVHSNVIKDLTAAKFVSKLNCVDSINFKSFCSELNCLDCFLKLNLYLSN